AIGANEASTQPAPLVFGRAPAWLALFLLPVALGIAWTLTAPPARGEDRIDAGARSAARACLAGAAILLAARTGPDSPANPGFVALGNLGAALSGSAALWALARLSSLGGLLEPPAFARRIEAAAFSALFWT